MRKSRKNQVSRIFALLLVSVLLTTSLAACGGGAQSTGGNDTVTSTGTTAQPAQTTGSAKSEQTAAPEGITFPLKEGVELEVWTGIPPELAKYVDSLAETEFFKGLEKRTNIHLTFRHPVAGNENTDFTMMLASGDVADIIKTSQNTNYQDGYDAAVNDQVFMDLTGLVEQYAPHYLAALENYDQYQPGYAKAAKTLEGRYVYISQVMKVPQGPFGGLYIRKDWLDDLGLEVPVTYADWENALTQFKEVKGATSPLLLPKAGYESMFQILNSGYDVGTEFYQVDGKVKYGPMEDGWKAYIEMLNRWYKNGLVDQDFFTATSIWPDTALVTTGKTGSFFTLYTFIASYEAANEDEDAEFVPVPNPVQNAGDKVHFKNVMYPTFGSVISADCENPEIALSLLDYFYTDEGSLYCNYGEEGVSFNYDSEGNPQFTDLISKNEKFTFSEALGYYCMPGARTVWQDWRRELGSVPEKDQVCFDVFSSNQDSQYIVPSYFKSAMSTDDLAEYGKILADVKTSVDENTALFITGVRPMSEWDAYVEQLKALGIERAIELVQNAYDVIK